MAESADRVAIAFDLAQIRKAQDRNPFVKISDIVGQIRYSYRKAEKMYDTQNYPKQFVHHDRLKERVQQIDLAERFVSQLVTTEVLQKMLPEDRKTAGHILTSWKQKKL